MQGVGVVTEASPPLQFQVSVPPSHTAPPEISLKRHRRQATPCEPLPALAPNAPRCWKVHPSNA